MARPYRCYDSRGHSRAPFLLMVFLAITVPACSSASDIGCTDSVSDDRLTAETCAQRDFDAQTTAMTHIYRSLRGGLSKGEQAALDAAQKQWLAYRADHCGFFVQMAGRENPAWQMTWSGAAARACEAELTKDRVAQLKSLENIADLQTQRTNVQAPSR